MTKCRTVFAGAVLLTLLLGAVGAQAQWVMVARAVSGRVQQMSQKSANGAGYDVAVVVLEANADKVYDVAVARLKAHEGVMIDSTDAKKHKVTFSRGAQVASLQATPLGDKLTQLVVASSLAPGGTDSNSLVVQGVMNVCKEMKVECTLSDQ